MKDKIEVKGVVLSYTIKERTKRVFEEAAKHFCLEPLCRAKTVATEQWVEGNLVISIPVSATDEVLTETGCRYFIVEALTHYGKDGAYDNLSRVEVLPHTVCKSTTFHDKTGKRIYEGDILKGYSYPFMDSDGSLNYYAEVVWIETTNSFGIKMHKAPTIQLRGIQDGSIRDIEGKWVDSEWEIIGNTTESLSA